jgi:hypothetical protein
MSDDKGTFFGEEIPNWYESPKDEAKVIGLENLC